MSQLALFDLVVPLADVAWGAYGTATGWGPNGSPATRTGYVITPPRIYTGGFAGTHVPKRKGERFLLLVLLDPVNDGQCGMYARPDAQFHQQPAPADRPLTWARRLSRRLPVADLRARDTIWHWDEPGKPRQHLQADPEPLGDGRFRLLVLVDGVLAVREQHGDLWVDVADPEREPWRAAT